MQLGDFLGYFFSVYMCVFCLQVHLRGVCVCTTPRGQKRASGALELGSKTTVGVKATSAPNYEDSSPLE